MYRERTDEEWDKHAARSFSVDLNELFQEEIDRICGDRHHPGLYNEVARNLIGLLSPDDLSQLALEGLSQRVGSYARRVRAAKPRKVQASARWDQVKDVRDRLEDYLVRTPDGLKRLLACTYSDITGASQIYGEQSEAFASKKKQMDEIAFRMKAERAQTIADMDRRFIRRILNV